MRQLGDQLDVGDRLVENDAVDRLHVLGNDLQQRLEALRRVPGLLEWDDNAQGMLSPAGLRFGPVYPAGTRGRQAPPGHERPFAAACGRRGAPQRVQDMREVLRSNDAVLIGFAQSLLRDRGIHCFIADQHVSVMEGSIGAFPRRLLVGEADLPAAKRALEEAGLGQWMVGEGEART